MAVGKEPSDIQRFRKWVQVYIGEQKQVLDRACYTVGGEICTDFMIRYERLHEDLTHVCHHLAVEPDLERLAHLVGGVRPKSIPVCDYYDEHTRKIVETVFDFELERFEYDFPSTL